jgi:hypothetical protein
MRASYVMALAVLLFVIARWSRNQDNALTIGVVLSGVFAVFVIALLDQGRTAEIAKGFAWLFFLGAAYNAIPPIGKVVTTSAGNAASGARATII